MNYQGCSVADAATGRASAWVGNSSPSRLGQDRQQLLFAPVDRSTQALFAFAFQTLAAYCEVTASALRNGRGHGAGWLASSGSGGLAAGVLVSTVAAATSSHPSSTRSSTTAKTLSSRRPRPKSRVCTNPGAVHPVAA